MKHTIATSWKQNMEFVSQVDQFQLTMDAQAEAGGHGNGIGPKKLMLSSLAGCTGMDVISILKKMRHEPQFFNIKVTGILTDDMPKVYESMHITYEFGGKDLDLEKLQKAVDLSLEKYCGVSHMYRKIMTISHEIQIVEQV